MNTFATGTTREDMETLHERLKVRAQHHCGSDEGSAGSSLRVVTPSMAQEAGKVRSSGTSTPQSSKSRRRFSLHADAAGDRAPQDCTSPASWAYSGTPSPMSSLSAGYQPSNEDQLVQFQPQSQRARCIRSSYCRQLSTYPADSSVSGCTAFATPGSCSPASNHSSQAACNICPDSEAKLVAARDAVVRPTLLYRLSAHTHVALR